LDPLKAMSVYRLQPLNNHPDWRGSNYRGTCLVGATNESAARETAANHFGIARLRKLGEDAPANPWLNAGLVTCLEVVALTVPAVPEGVIMTAAADGWQLVDW
jgi:hypothetical protein